ncbi:hypothetical protein [Dyadobacter sp. CY312]|uniref:hypothetical protein n=1 Tax=Dyadobacter sp. CY312 TaxID=2907303 RepID=UPI001F44617F|nr:hypothetical protein [Dyadobacter sp. CY312]MCE7042454.1 hypothetical protein [Dyadobacter sp. CY312]
MENQKFKEGDWVKEKNGTQGMTVIGYAHDSDEVRCKFRDNEEHDVEESFKEDDLIAL